MSTLTEHAQKHIERVMRELSGDDDFMPFLTIRNDRDQVAYVGMDMPEEEEGKDVLANYITALCMVHRGVEVTFATVAWLVLCQQLPDVAPSQHPDRQEQVFVLTVDTTDQFQVHTATVVRDNDMVGVGLWSPMNATVAEGRFADAIRMGMDLGQKLPPEMRDYIDSKEAEGELADLVERTAVMIDEVRHQAASKN